MSYYRESPPHYSRRSPPRLERELIEQEISLKNALRSEAENRRLLDEISLLQIKLRKTEELEVKVEGLIKQNSILGSENDQMARQLSERRYELERMRANTVQLQERDAIKSAQLGEVNRSLQLQIELLKKERLESNKLYEGHIQKLEYMLEDKIKELDILTIRCNDLNNAKEASDIRFEEEKNRLKNLVARTTHDMERELEYTKERNGAEKTLQIDTLKKNYASQILLLEDQINKLKAANDYKHNEFENQLAENRNLRTRHDHEMKALELENNGLREKLLQLEELNRSEVVNIEVKYRDIQKKDTSELITGHVAEIKTLISEIDKLNWLLRDKNQEIQNLIREKKQQKIQEEERQLALRAELDTVKNKLDYTCDKAAADSQEQARRIQNLAHALQRDADAHQARVSHLTITLNAQEAELKSKQNELDRTRAENAIAQKQFDRQYQELSQKQEKTERALQDTQFALASEQNQHQEDNEKARAQVSELSQQNKQLETQREELQEKLERQSDSAGDYEKVLKVEIEALRKNIAILQQNLSTEQSRHAKEMSELSANLRSKLEKLQKQQKQSLQQAEESSQQERETLERKIQKLQRDREEANRKLAQYIEMYNNLEKYFKNPAEGSICQERAQSSLYQTLGQVTESVINIF